MRQILVFLSLMLSLGTRSQTISEELVMHYVEKGSLTGRQWKSEHVSYTRWDDWSRDLDVNVADASRKSASHRKVTVGLYQTDGTLIWQTKKWRVVSTDGNILHLEDKAKGKFLDINQEHVFSFDSLWEHLRHGRWYVRFTADGLDVMVTTKNTQ